ncbi:hypothetical protein DAPPUDRAFT_308036 [Daphnia pulex]|uniref:Uncharacterized protein n=1 Tax=Daphnia pulex TaxID=6669 RepID=E9HYG3_DAPPU|nr:hypothetical protein DAPPUDRAFT_308036 [Daphnia pulex]|eukprot:EFX63217.1 hypothetical protein DAPPUDRAFT_308036 [Daphnia pulex]
MNSSRNQEWKELPKLESLATTTEMLKVLQDECKWIKEKFNSEGIEIKNAKEFAKANLTSLFFSEGLNANATLNDSDTTVDLLRKVYGEIKNEKAKLLSLFNQTTDECKTSLMQFQSNLNVCENENRNVANLVSFQYKDMNSSRKEEWKELTILGSNATTTELLNALQEEWKWIAQKLILDEIEIKNAKNFVKSNLTGLLSSEGLTSMASLNDNNTTVDHLRKVFNELKSEKENFLNQSTDECKTKFMQSQSDLNLCKIENENVATLVSLHYKEMNSSRNKEWKELPKFVLNATTTEMLKVLQDECKWIEGKITSDGIEIKNAKKFVKLNLTDIFFSEGVNSSATLNDSDTTVDLLKKVYGEIKNEKAKLLSLFNQTTDECKTSLMQFQSNLNVCENENRNVANLVSFQYKDMNSSRKEEWKELTILGSNATTTELLNALQEEWKWIAQKLILDEIEIKNAKNFVKSNLTGLLTFEGLTSMASLNDNNTTVDHLRKGLNSSATLNDSDTTVDLLKKVYGEIKNEKAKLLSLFNQTTDECKTSLMQFQSNLNVCENENRNVANLVSFQYKDMNSSRKEEWKELTILGSNATTTELLNALQEEWKWIAQKLNLDEIEIKNAKNFVKSNLTGLLSSKGLTSMASLNDNNTTVDHLRKMYNELKSEKENLLNQSTDECKTKFMQSQSNLNLCKIENENVATLVSLHYKEMNSSRNKERKELLNLVSNLSTTEMIKVLQDECNWIEGKFISDGIEIKNAKEFAKENLTKLFFSDGLSSNATLNDNDTTVDLLKKLYGELKNQKAKLLSLSNDKSQECKTSLMQSQSDFNICKIENENVATLVSLHYKEMNSSRNKESKELSNLVSNVSTTEMIKALHDECNWIEEKFTSDGIEIKNAQEFAKENLTKLFFSEGLSSKVTLNDSDTTVDLLKKVYGELKNQKAKLLSLSNDKTEECKTSLMHPNLISMFVKLRMEISLIWCHCIIMKWIL